MPIFSITKSKKERDAYLNFSLTPSSLLLGGERGD
jgi:hypothetical protein